MGGRQAALLTIPHAVQEIFQILRIHFGVEQWGFYTCQVHFGLHSTQAAQKETPTFSFTQICISCCHFLL